MDLLRPSPVPYRHPQSEGFTLVELLVASAIGLVMTLGGLAVWFGNLRATTTLTTGQELRDRWSRVALFINADIAESCNAVANAGALQLTVDPSPDTACAGGDSITITYSLNGATLQRNGPPINADGTLNLNANPTLEPLVDGVTVFNPACTTTLQACYQLTLSQGTSNYTDSGGAAIAGRARVREYN